jgi:hypothetical protein
LVWRRERAKRDLVVRQTAKQFGPKNAPCIFGMRHIPVPYRRRRPRRGSRREMQSRLESIPASASSILSKATAGFFFGLAEREALVRTLGSTNCEAVWTEKCSVHFRHTAHPCA